MIGPMPKKPYMHETVSRMALIGMVKTMFSGSVPTATKIAEKFGVSKPTLAKTLKGEPAGKNASSKIKAAWNEWVQGGDSPSSAGAQDDEKIGSLKYLETYFPYYSPMHKTYGIIAPSEISPAKAIMILKGLAKKGASAKEVAKASGVTQNELRYLVHSAKDMSEISTAMKYTLRDAWNNHLVVIDKKDSAYLKTIKPLPLSSGKVSKGDMTPKMAVSIMKSVSGEPLSIPKTANEFVLTLDEVSQVMSAASDPNKATKVAEIPSHVAKFVAERWNHEVEEKVSVTQASTEQPTALVAKKIIANSVPWTSAVQQPANEHEVTSGEMVSMAKAMLGQQGKNFSVSGLTKVLGISVPTVTSIFKKGKATKGTSKKIVGKWQVWGEQQKQGGGGAQQPVALPSQKAIPAFQTMPSSSTPEKGSVSYFGKKAYKYENPKPVSPSEKITARNVAKMIVTAYFGFDAPAQDIAADIGIGKNDVLEIAKNIEMGGVHAHAVVRDTMVRNKIISWWNAWLKDKKEYDVQMTSTEAYKTLKDAIKYVQAKPKWMLTKEQAKSLKIHDFQRMIVARYGSAMPPLAKFVLDWGLFMEHVSAIANSPPQMYMDQAIGKAHTAMIAKKWNEWAKTPLPEGMESKLSSIVAKPVAPFDPVPYRITKTTFLTLIKAVFGGRGVYDAPTVAGAFGLTVEDLNNIFSSSSTQEDIYSKTSAKITAAWNKWVEEKAGVAKKEGLANKDSHTMPSGLKMDTKMKHSHLGIGVAGAPPYPKNTIYVSSYSPPIITYADFLGMIRIMFSSSGTKMTASSVANAFGIGAPTLKKIVKDGSLSYLKKSTRLKIAKRWNYWVEGGGDVLGKAKKLPDEAITAPKGTEGGGELDDPVEAIDPNEIKQLIEHLRAHYPNKDGYDAIRQLALKLRQKPWRKSVFRGFKSDSRTTQLSLLRDILKDKKMLFSKFEGKQRHAESWSVKLKIATSFGMGSEGLGIVLESRPLPRDVVLFMSDKFVNVVSGIAQKMGVEGYGSIRNFADECEVIVRTGKRKYRLCRNIVLMNIPEGLLSPAMWRDKKGAASTSDIRNAIAERIKNAANRGEFLADTDANYNNHIGWRNGYSIACRKGKFVYLRNREAVSKWANLLGGHIAG